MGSANLTDRAPRSWGRSGVRRTLLWLTDTAISGVCWLAVVAGVPCVFIGATAVLTMVFNLSLVLTIPSCLLLLVAYSVAGSWLLGVDEDEIVPPVSDSDSRGWLSRAIATSKQLIPRVAKALADNWRSALLAAAFGSGFGVAVTTTDDIVDMVARLVSVRAVAAGHTTLTDVYLRPEPGTRKKPVGLAEKGSIVRVLSTDPESDWVECEVERHGRPKANPNSADRGWLRLEYLAPQ